MEDSLRQEVQRWLSQAEHDLATVSDLIEKKRFGWACFVAQQSAAKAVKAVYISRGHSIERIHRILDLIKGDAKRDLPGVTELLAHVDAARKLDGFYMPSRYPDAIPFGVPYERYTEEKAREALEWARQILNDCRQLLANT